MTQHTCRLSSENVHPGSPRLIIINGPRMAIGIRASAYSALVLLRTGTIIQSHLEWSFQSGRQNLVKTPGHTGSIET